MELILLVVVAVLAGGLVSHRVFRESDALLVFSLAPLAGVFFVLAVANWKLPGWSVLPALLLVFLPGPKLVWPKFGKFKWTLIGLGALLVGLFTWYQQVRYLDSDNWIHEPLIASYTLGILPPVNPFSPELSLNGHYGRDLLMAQLTPRGHDPLGTTWLVNPVLQVSSFLSLFSVIRVLTSGFWQGYLGSVMAFLGMNVGFRVGLLDSFDGNNGVVYAVLPVLFYMMFRVLQSEALSARQALQWVFAGCYLGLYQIIYESHFGLLFLAGTTLGVLLFRKKEPWIALLVVAAIALPLACVEGGVFTDLAGRAAGHRDAALQDSPLNPSQHVGMSFPKKNLLQVLTTRSVQQRVSVAYRTGPFSSFFRTPREDGYIFIFDPRFMNCQWLPLYLAPLSLFWLWRRKHFVGLGFWFFGAWAYLVPGLVNFGPAYEYESFRWEFAAGFGLAVALGCSLGGVFEAGKGRQILRLERKSDQMSLHFFKDFLPVLGAGCVLAASLVAGEKLVNGMIIYLQKNPKALFAEVDRWRTQQEPLGMTYADLDATRWMAPQVRPRDRFLSNRIDDTTVSVWRDSVISSRTGALPAGHAFSPISEGFPAAPPYYGDALYRAYWATGDSQLLQLTPVRWLFVDLAKVDQNVLKRLESMEKSPVFEDASGNRRQVFHVPEAPPKMQSELPLEISVAGFPKQPDLQVGRRYPISVTVKNPGPKPRRLGPVRCRVEYTGEWPSTEVPLELEPAAEPLKPGEEVTFEHSLVTPLDEGDFILDVTLPVDKPNSAPKVEIPFNIDYLLRLKLVRPRVELPANLTAQRFYDVPIGFTSSKPLETVPSVIFSYRLRRDTGEPVWELDRIPQVMSFDLQPAKEWVTSFQLMTPSQPGNYLLQLFLQDPRTHRSYQIGTETTIKVLPGERVQG